MIIDTEDEEKDLLERFNKESWQIKTGFIEKASLMPQLIKNPIIKTRVFNVDIKTTKETLVLNEIVHLKRSYKRKILMNDLLEKQLQDLNKEQLEAVKYQGSPLLLLLGQEQEKLKH